MEAVNKNWTNLVSSISLWYIYWLLYRIQMISIVKWDIKLKWNKHIPGMPQGMKIFPRFYYKKCYCLWNHKYILTKTRWRLSINPFPDNQKAPGHIWLGIIGWFWGKRIQFNPFDTYTHWVWPNFEPCRYNWDIWWNRKQTRSLILFVSGYWKFWSVFTLWTEVIKNAIMHSNCQMI